MNSPTIQETAAQVEAATKNLTEAQKARDNAVREALDSGVSINELIAPTGLSKARLYQIRDRRR